MAFRIKRTEPVEIAIRRIALEQIDRSLQELAGRRLKLADKIHQIRKRCKKLRGLLRLAAPLWGAGFETQDDLIRKLARRLSKLRDSTTLVASFDRLLRDSGRRAAPRELASIRKFLLNERQRIVVKKAGVKQRLQRVEKDLLLARRTIVGLECPAREFDAIASGLAGEYELARKGLLDTQLHLSTATLHEWRKHVKYHWHHCCLLRGVWPRALAARGEEAYRLSEWLGNDHDLSVLKEFVDEHAAELGSSQMLATFQSLLGHQRQQLQASSWSLGRRLFVDSQEVFQQRYRAYWEVWRLEDDCR